MQGITYMNDDKFVIIYDWMVERLKLSGNRLIIYGIIYGFSKNGEWFQGSAAYLCKRSGVTERGIRKILKGLREDGLLAKKERIQNGVIYVDYRAINPGTKFTPEQSSPLNKVPLPPEQSSVGGVNKVPIIINKDNKKIINNARAKKNKFHDFPQRTDTDYDTIEDYLTGKLSNPNDKDLDKDIKM